MKRGRRGGGRGGEAWGGKGKRGKGRGGKRRGGKGNGGEFSRTISHYTCILCYITGTSTTLTLYV